MKFDSIAIGGGMAGLSAALRLAEAGQKTLSGNQIRYDPSSGTYLMIPVAFFRTSIACLLSRANSFTSI